MDFETLDKQMRRFEQSLDRAMLEGIYVVNGRFRVKGDTVDIYPSFADFCYRVSLWDDEVERLESFDPISGPHQWTTA